MTNYSYCSWTPLQWPPWGQKKVAIVERWAVQRGWNKSECMAVVERWPSVEVRLCIYVCFAKSLILYFFNMAKIRLQKWHTRWNGIYKALWSKSWSNIKFSLWFTSINKAIGKEKPAVHLSESWGIFSGTPSMQCNIGSLSNHLSV